MRVLSRVNWQPAESSSGLPEDELHIWRVSLQDSPCHPEWLDAHERKRAEKMLDDSLRRRHCAARTALRRLLGNYLSVSPKSISIEIGPQGKPELSSPNRLMFNLSHSGDWALLAFSRIQQVGADLELIRDVPNSKGVARRVMNSEEIRELETAGFAAAEFMRLWTRMEARQKCFGQGVFGERIGESRVGMISFDAGADLLGSIAWADPNFTPRLRYFSPG